MRNRVTEASESRGEEQVEGLAWVCVGICDDLAAFPGCGWDGRAGMGKAGHR